MKKNKYLLLSVITTTVLLGACGNEKEKEVKKEEVLVEKEKIQIDEQIKLVENDKYKVIAAITEIEEAGETDLAVTNVIIKNETEKDILINKIKVKALNEDGTVKYEKETNSVKGYYIEPEKQGKEMFVYELEKGVKKEEYKNLTFEVEVIVEEYEGPKFLSELGTTETAFELINGFLFVEGKVKNNTQDNYKSVYTNFIIYNKKEEIIKISEYSAVAELKKGGELPMENAIKFDGKIEDVKKIEMHTYGIKEN